MKKARDTKKNYNEKRKYDFENIMDTVLFLLCNPCEGEGVKMEFPFCVRPSLTLYFDSCEG